MFTASTKAGESGTSSADRAAAKPVPGPRSDARKLPGAGSAAAATVVGALAVALGLGFGFGLGGSSPPASSSPASSPGVFFALTRRRVSAKSACSASKRSGVSTLENMAAVKRSMETPLLSRSSRSLSSFKPQTPLCLPALESNSLTTSLNSSAVKSFCRAADMPRARAVKLHRFFALLSGLMYSHSRSLRFVARARCCTISPGANGSWPCQLESMNRPSTRRSSSLMPFSWPMTSWPMTSASWLKYSASANVLISRWNLRAPIVSARKAQRTRLKNCRSFAQRKHSELRAPPAAAQSCVDAELRTRQRSGKPSPVGADIAQLLSRTRQRICAPNQTAAAAGGRGFQRACA